MNINCFISVQVMGLKDDDGTFCAKSVREAIGEGLRKAGYSFESVVIGPITQTPALDAPAK
jgi:hypothetical protein